MTIKDILSRIEYTVIIDGMEHSNRDITFSTWMENMIKQSEKASGYTPEKKFDPIARENFQKYFALAYYAGLLPEKVTETRTAEIGEDGCYIFTVETSGHLTPENDGTESQPARIKLGANSKKARENIRSYIVENFTPENYTDTPPQEWPEIAIFILDIFRSEKPAIGSRARMSEQERFTDWASGLPSILDCCYYYNRSAVDDLGTILEETAGEKVRFTEEQAEAYLTSLIYRELKKGENKK